MRSNGMSRRIRRREKKVEKRKGKAVQKGENFGEKEFCKQR